MKYSKDEYLKYVKFFQKRLRINDYYTSYNVPEACSKM